MQKERKKYSKKFKKEVVRLVLEQVRTVVPVARGLGVNENLQHK